MPSSDTDFCAAEGSRFAGSAAVIPSIQADSIRSPEGPIWSREIVDRNLLLAFALSMAVFSGWLAWQQNVVVPERKAALERARAAAEAAAPAVEDREWGAAGSPTEPGQVAAESLPPARTAPAAAAREPALAPPDSPSVPPWQGELESGTVVAQLSNRGGVLTGWQLRDYFETPRREVPVELIDLPADAPAMLSTSFAELGLGDLSNALYEVERAGEGEVVFVLRRGGVEIRKTYSRPTDDYTIDLRVDVTNGTTGTLSPRFDVLVPAATNDRPDFGELSLVALVGEEVTSELVAGIGSPGFFSGLFGGGDEGPIEFRSELEYAGFDMRYFTGVLLPESAAESGATLLPHEAGKSAFALVTLGGVDVASGDTVSRHFTAFIGPKQPAILELLGEDIQYAIMRGDSWVAPLTTFFEWALHRVHDFVPNYGLAIIVLTILVRLATWPIMVKQMKSAERMRELMPRIKELQEKYKDDRQKQSEETFKLYRETGVNPLGGCLPMLLQLPVFIGLFYALQSSIDLRQAPFFLWINDLSAPATLFTLPGVDFPVRILPILMGISMYVQQKMMPQAGMDPAQAKMMLIMMPGMMLVISYTFPSGLVLYWMISNVLGIGHQLYVRRKMHAGE